MSAKLLMVTAVAAITFTFTACAQANKTAVKTGTRYAQLLQSSFQRTLPGAPGMEPVEEYRFVIVWKSTQTPETFFWRGTDTWMECMVAKVHKKPKPDKDSWYTLEEVSLDKIKKNDTLELLPVAGGKFPVPEVIPATSTNTIFFKTAKSTWLSLPVKNIKRRPDIIMQ